MTKTRLVTEPGQWKQLRTTMSGMWSNKNPEGAGVRGGDAGGRTQRTEPARLHQRRFDLAESTTRCHVSVSCGKTLCCASCVDPLSGVFVGARRPTSSKHGGLPSVTLRPFGILICVGLALTSQSYERLCRVWCARAVASM